MDDTTDRLDLDAIRARVENNGLTAGPWAWEPTGDKDASWAVGLVVGDDGIPMTGQIDKGAGEIIDSVCYQDDGRLQDAIFIAHARTDVPVLLAEVARLRTERDTLAAELDRDRHEFKPVSGPFGCCGNNRRTAAVHRTSRVVLAEHAKEQ